MFKLFFLSVAMPILGFCQSNLENHDEILKAIFATGNQEAYISHCDNKKVYLREENILVTEKEIYLYLGETGYLPIRATTDSQGYYISTVDSFSALSTCRWCGKKYFVVCKNPDCPNPNRK